MRCSIGKRSYLCGPKLSKGMTKAELVSLIAKRTGVERQAVLTTVEAFMEEVKNSLEKGENVHLRGFGSFVVKHRAQKTGRILARNTTIIIPAHDVPAFKPADTFVDKVMPAGFDGTYQTAVAFFKASKEDWEHQAVKRAAELKEIAEKKSQP